MVAWLLIHKGLPYCFHIAGTYPVWLHFTMKTFNTPSPPPYSHKTNNDSLTTEIHQNGTSFQICPILARGEVGEGGGVIEGEGGGGGEGEEGEWEGREKGGSREVAI